MCVVEETLGLSVRKEFKAGLVCDSEGNKYFIITSVTLARPIPLLLSYLHKFGASEFLQNFLFA